MKLIRCHTWFFCCVLILGKNMLYERKMKASAGWHHWHLKGLFLCQISQILPQSNLFHRAKSAIWIPKTHYIIDSIIIIFWGMGINNPMKRRNLSI